MDKNDPLQGLHAFLAKLQDGVDIGVISEAGCPGIADPGALAASYAHDHGLQVVPLVGPSSILLALIASGMNGQSFVFHGYLPNKAGALSKRLRLLEQEVKRSGQTQIFMEAPYRNGFVLEQVVGQVSPEIRLCIACDINAPTAYIRTQPIKKWKGSDWSTFHKRPAIFLLG